MDNRPAIRQRASAKLLVLGLCAICGLAVLARFPRWIRGPDEAYVIVAEDAWAGRLGLANYDDEAMKARSGAMTEGRNRSLLSPTPPSIAVLLLPLAWVPADARPIVWLLLNVGALLATGCLLARIISWPTRHPWLACAAAAALLLSEPLAENLARGQVYLLLMPAVAAVLMATATGKSAGASGLAICTAAKLWGGAVWMALLAARAWRLLGTAAIVTAVLLIAALWVAGPQTWSYYIQVVLPNWLTTPMMTVTAYQTIPAMFAHLLRADPQWNPDPLANLPMLALALTIIAGASLVAVTMWQAAKEERRLAAVAASIVLAVMFSPVAEQYHYLLIVPSIMIAVERDGLRWDLRTAMLTLVLFLLFFPLPFKSRELADVAAGVFAYPRVVAALLLWTLLLIPRLSSSEGRARDHHADNRDRP